MSNSGLLMLIFAVCALLVGALICTRLRRRNIHIWITAYLSFQIRRLFRKQPMLTHLLVCVADHYEPMWSGVDYATEVARVDRWVTEYPENLGHVKDTNGRPPQHSFFYPAEEYRPEHLDKIGALCQAGYGEVEIHLHHDADTPENFTKSITDFIEILNGRHGMLGRNKQTGQLGYAFIHGNWTLCNSDPNGLYCGINDEITLLKETGCYVDMTLPSAPSATQTSTINSIYYAKSGSQPKGHDRGIRSEVSMDKPGPEYLQMIQGPLGFLFGQKRIENGDLTGSMPGTLDRIKAWVGLAPFVSGRPEWRFIKLHCHGTQEKDHGALLGDQSRLMFEQLSGHYNDGKRYSLHFVTAREMFNVSRAAEDGHSGNPADYFDYQVEPPTYQPTRTAAV